MKRHFLIIFLIFIISISKAQFGLGVSGIYNFQTESFGVGGRIEIPFGAKVSLVPQLNYYPSFNKINEYYAGAAIHYYAFNIKKFRFYLLAHGGYNAWVNYQTSHMEDASYSNWNFEGGIGLTTSSCLRPFIEYRYNTKWYETALHVGLLYFFGCKSGKGHGGGSSHKKYKIMSCPAYD